MIVGLGNPGKKYARSKHNIGWMVLDRLMKDHSVSPARLKFEALFGEARIKGERVMIVKPMTYMNHSGRAIRALADYFDIPHDDIFVIVDDIDLSFGQLRIRKSGGPGTHNGMRSIVDHLRGEDFPRLRIGISDDHPRGDLAGFVLGDFPKALQPELDELLDRAAGAVEDYLARGIEYSMNRNNG